MRNNFIEFMYSEIDQLLPYLPTNFFETCLKYESIFHLSIPKTGSSFLNKILKENKMIKSFRPPHGTCSSLKLFPDSTDSIPGKNSTFYPDTPGFNESLKVTIIRNPYDWLVSMYYHERLIKPEDSRDLMNISSGAIKEAAKIAHVEGVGSLRKLYRTFEEFVWAYVDPESYWPSGLVGFKNFYPFQIFDDKGVCKVDYCLRNETLYLATYSLLIAMGVDLGVAQKTIKKKRENVSKKRGASDYRIYYTDKMVLGLEDKFKIINKHMNYNFENKMTSNDFIISLKNLNYSPINNRIIQEDS